MKLLLALAILTTCLSVPSLMKPMEIKQAMYTFNMDPAQDIASETFVITVLPLSVNSPSNTCQIPAAHFQRNSSILSSEEANLILAGIEKCRITQSSPLTITGFTCELGPDQYNQTLSLQRAETVANLLRNHGFTVATVRGKGSQHPISLDRQDLFKNRRVEIEPNHWQ